MLTEKTFDTGAVAIHYAEGPACGMPLVLVHGANSRWQSFLPVLPMLSFRYHTYALEMRGFGRSGRTPGAYHMADFASDIVQFCVSAWRPRQYFWVTRWAHRWRRWWLPWRRSSCGR
jgi:pimeloyl-ACP methyl ester carboxylesterase